MGVLLQLLGNAALSIAASIVANMIDRCVQRRNKKEPTPDQRKGS